jgi:hypothetical protein
MGTVRWRSIQTDGQTVVEEIHKVVFHRFRLSDVEDPDLWAAEPIYKWEKSEPGQFVMKHAIDKPVWHRNIDHVTYSYQYIIVAELEMKKLSEYYLRWGKDGNT